MADEEFKALDVLFDEDVVESAGSIKGHSIMLNHNETISTNNETINNETIKSPRSVLGPISINYHSGTLSSPSR